MSTPWNTAWQGPDLVVFRDDTEVDRFAAAQIERVIFIHRGAGDKPGDLLFALVELPDEHILLPADTGRDGMVPVDPADRELVRDIWCGMREALEHYLTGTTLDDLCQRKRQRATDAMLNNLKANDKVVTNGGIYGTIVSVRDDKRTVQLKISENPVIRVEVARTAISGMQDAPADEKK